MSFTTGENVGSYRIMEKLGRGGMATVFKAYHASLDRYVALKVLHPAFLEDPNFLARFQREARLVAKLEHQNIVPVYDFADHEEQPYLVMKYVEGETLKAHLNRGRLSPELVWDVVNAVGAGLAHAHNEGILHRDIKPSNVIVANDGRIYLADFGLARIAQMGESTLSSDMIMGTPQYISPEQAKGEKNLDNRTDIYSFAVMLYEMVVGQVPFSSDTPFSIIHDHIYSPLPLPHLVNPSVPDEVERVLLKALAKERDDRHENVEALSQAFKQAWEDSNVDMADVTMTSPIRYVAPAPTPPPTVPPVATVVQEAKVEEATLPPEKTKIAEKPKKKKRNWWAFIAVVVLLFAAIAFAISTLGQDNLLNSLENEIPNEELPLPPLNEEGEAPLPMGEETHPDILAARKDVGENPDDPYAHRDLALALLDNSERKNQLVYKELSLAADLAGDDLRFFEDTGFAFMDRGAFTASAAMFLRATKISQEVGEDAEWFISLFHETAYKAASQPEMPNYLPFEEIGKIDEPMMLIVQARHTFYHGDPEDAMGLLNEVKRIKPGFPEALLFEGEIHARRKNADEARQVFEILLADLGTPEWIVVEAENALSQLP
ncbi:MAG: protein kinase [Anaerolineae bacterium]|jgi:serine/threonine protein kinase|nr:protein kinase [Anaerolineae bacterium]MBT7991526.1 protein kinase [Anaerolineae bacterium]